MREFIMAKQKINLEYEMNTMPGILYKRVATPEGLASWFAEDAASEDDIVFSFLWHKDVSRAIVIDSIPNEMIRFRWEDEDTDDYFEFRIVQPEMSRSIILCVTDFSEEEELEDVIQLWNFQIANLKRILAA